MNQTLATFLNSLSSSSLDIFPFLLISLFSIKLLTSLRLAFFPPLISLRAVLIITTTYFLSKNPLPSRSYFRNRQSTAFCSCSTEFFCKFELFSPTPVGVEVLFRSSLQHAAVPINRNILLLDLHQ